MKSEIHTADRSAPNSRGRSLLRDIGRGIGQQMFFWGCDVRHAAGNLLVRAGMQRLARRETGGEGSSRYRMPWQGGVVELHSFCIGWYPTTLKAKGIIFIRGKERLKACQSETPLTPGHYENDRIMVESSDELLITIRPLVTWMIEYEEQVIDLAGWEYRTDCWKKYLSRIGSRPWLSPEQSLDWYRDFLSDPQQLKRPREILRRRKTPGPTLSASWSR